jgi:4a-hydroxytetrahydrobiopterin dehydratase
MATKLDAAARSAALAELKGWALVEGREAISKRFMFKDFNEAFGWMARVALLADKIDHHPEWSNVYRTVDVVLATHDVGGLSELDIRMAKAMDAYAGV